MRSVASFDLEFARFARIQVCATITRLFFQGMMRSTRCKNAAMQSRVSPTIVNLGRLSVYRAGLA